LDGTVLGLGAAMAAKLLAGYDVKPTVFKSLCVQQLTQEKHALPSP
jgi:hypothetical protein